MGMFDSVWFNCITPGCSGRIDAQSKDGPCDLKDYDNEDVPVVVAAGLLGKRVQCGSCSKTFVIGSVAVPRSVPLSLREGRTPADDDRD